MSDTTTEPTEVVPAETGAVEAVAERTDPPEGDSPEDGQADGPLAKQAAKWRKRSRELEAELAAATDTITGLHRTQAEALAEREGVKPNALWAVTDLDGLLNDGQVDPARVRAAVKTAVEQLGVQPTNGLYVPGEGRATNPPGGDGKARWDQAFRPTYKR